MSFKNYCWLFEVKPCFFLVTTRLGILSMISKLLPLLDFFCWDGWGYFLFCCLKMGERGACTLGMLLYCMRSFVLLFSLNISRVIVQCCGQDLWRWNDTSFTYSYNLCPFEFCYPHETEKQNEWHFFNQITFKSLA